MSIVEKRCREGRTEKEAEVKEETAGEIKQREMEETTKNMETEGDKLGEYVYVSTGHTYLVA
jgi:hypothetical protein